MTEAEYFRNNGSFWFEGKPYHSLGVRNVIK